MKPSLELRETEAFFARGSNMTEEHAGYALTLDIINRGPVVSTVTDVFLHLPFLDEPLLPTKLKDVDVTAGHEVHSVVAPVPNFRPIVVKGFEAVREPMRFFFSESIPKEFIEESVGRVTARFTNAPDEVRVVAFESSESI